MARPKMKLTGFARFLIIMVFVAPLAYVGASYYNGEDGLLNLKRLVGMEASSPEAKPSKPATTTSSSNNTELMQKRIKALEAENAELRARIKLMEGQEKAPEKSTRQKW